MRHLVRINKTLLVRGQATLNLIDGEARILGGPLNKFERIVIQREKQLPIESEDEAEIEITLAKTGSIMEMEGSSIPESWKDVVNSLDLTGKSTAMIIGASDVGKSALCTFLMNELINRRRKVRVLDADIGQADIGPPTTISLATPTLPKPSLSHLEPERMFFVGHNTPSFVHSQLLHGIKHMLNCDSAEMTVINTDGWVSDPAAVLYKKRLITTVKPDIVIGIGSRNSLNAILQITRTRQVIVEASRALLPRTRNERKEIRKTGYQRFLTNSRLHTFHLSEIKLQLRESIKQAISKGSISLRNVILGFLNDKGFMEQIGILETMTPKSMTVYSRAISQVTAIEFGYVRLSRDGSELGFLE